MKALIDHTFLVLIIILMVTSTILVSSTINNVMRQKRPRLGLPGGKKSGSKNLFYPLLILALIAFTAVYTPNKIALTVTLGCYLWIGGMIYLSHRLSSQFYLCDNGIIPDISDPINTVVMWPQVMDMVERKAEGGSEYVFSYNWGRKQQGGMKLKRIQVFVPDAKRESFEKIVSLKLNDRFDNSGLPKIDLKDLQTG